MKTRNSLLKTIGAAALTLAIGIGLPITAKAENQNLNETNYKIRIDTPDADSINTTLCTIVSVYMQKDFCMFNLLIADEAGGTDSSKDFYLTDPATGKNYPTKKVGGSHLTRNETWKDGRRQLAVTFKGLPKGIQRVDLHMPGIATHILGIHLDQNGNNIAYHSPLDAVEFERKGNKQFLWITAKEVAEAQKMHKALSNIKDVSTTITTTPEAKPQPKEKPKTSTVQPFLSPDLALYDLRGKVKSVKTGDITISFTTDGKIKAMNGNPISQIYKIKRDSKGRITHMEELETDYDGGHSGEVYTWAANNLVKTMSWYNPEGDVATSYYYDQNGYLSKKTRKGFAGDTVDEINTYKYLKTDNFGNWTMRIENSINNAYGGQNAIEETREITYY